MANSNKRKISISVPQKSVPLAIVLTIIFGPLGLLYVSILGAIVMFVVTLIISFFIFGLGFLFTWPVCVIWAYLSVKKYNSQIIQEEI
jgi:hypothetical protein